RPAVTPPPLPAPAAGLGMTHPAITFSATRPARSRASGDGHRTVRPPKGPVRHGRVQPEEPPSAGDAGSRRSGCGRDHRIRRDRLYRFTLELVAPADSPLKFEDVLGQAAVVEIDQADGQTRFVHGIVNRLSQGRRDNRFVHYRAELVPRLWMLTKQSRSRIFQQKYGRTVH